MDSQWKSPYHTAIPRAWHGPGLSSPFHTTAEGKAETAIHVAIGTTGLITAAVAPLVDAPLLKAVDFAVGDVNGFVAMCIQSSVMMSLGIVWWLLSTVRR